jgi:carbamate kinase
MSPAAKRKRLKQFISGLTFARGSNQPFISNAIVFMSSSRSDIFRLFDFENTVEGIPLLILIYPSMNKNEMKK